MSDSSFEREFYKSLGPVLDQARAVLMSRLTPRAQNRSVLDTGSGVIMLHDVHITDPDYFVKVSGFEGSSKMTEGLGYSPLKFRDQSGQEFHYRTKGAHKMPQHKMPQQILGFGPLLRVGFKLTANSPGDITLTFPNG